MEDRAVSRNTVPEAPVAPESTRKSEMADLLRKLKKAADKQNIYDTKIGQTIMNSNDALYDHYLKQKHDWTKRVKTLTAQAVEFGASPEMLEETFRS